MGRTSKHIRNPFRILYTQGKFTVKAPPLPISSTLLASAGHHHPTTTPPPPHITAMSSSRESALVKPFRLDSVTEARLSRLAEETGRKKLSYRRELIEQGMDDLEDAYLGAVALEAHHRSGEATIPLDQVMGNLGMAD
jgi:RHH-type rel operon transcriptional repressor/antitoxin RelB